MIQSTRKALFVGICLCHGSGIRSPESNSKLKQQKKQQKNTRNMLLVCMCDRFLPSSQHDISI